MRPAPNPLAPRDLLVLSALAGGPLHGYGIIKAVEAESDAAKLLDPANLYRLLRRMRADGWVEEVPEAGAAEADGRRRAYRLTTRGRDVLLSEVERLEELLSRVRPVLAGGPGRWE
jgi:DNA-binding PadR family transcriptional regulator